VTWLYRDADQHKCDLPKLGPIDARHGDVWQCDVCQVLYRVEDQEHHGMFLVAVPLRQQDTVLRRINRKEG
jgi:hypothetical protein